LKELRVRLLGTLQNLEETTKNSALITQKINDDIHSSGGIFAEIEALAGQLRKLREFLQTGIIQPLGSIAVTVSALSKGSEAFSEALRKPRNVKPPRTER
jgi:hypothetical protein